MRGRSPKVGSEPNAVNAGPKPDAEPKPNAINACSIGKCKKCNNEGQLRNSTGHYKVVTLIFLPSCSVEQGWGLSVEIPMSWMRDVDRPSSHNSSCRGGWVKAASGLSAKVGTTRQSCGVGGRDGWPMVIARLAMESKRIEPEPTKYVPSGIAKLYGPECGLSLGPACVLFGSRGLGVSTFPWRRLTDTRERRSRHLSFYDP
ncbi:hypothetical protein CRG98_015328 [Punica granatum]|uniref:Uncharacterized protein n=1 Tax=Punica granatum TaxID=22663 RepID=A0A2I0K6V9_PUNGR|nr:hypothetical protein CRG98_015328 [Punica granatum]